MIAQRINYEVRVEEGKLIFKPPCRQKCGVTLKWRYNMTEINASMSSLNLVDEVVVNSWNQAEQKIFTSTASSGSESSRAVVNKGKFGTTKVKKAFSKYKSILYKLDTPLATQQEVDNLAKAMLDKISMEYMSVEASSIGIPEIKSGYTLDISGVNEKVSGTYYIDACEHIVDEEGYHTKSYLKRGVENG